MSSDRHTSLVIMAAGIGSRFGQGIKQLTSFGPSGEIIMDYSIYDALKAGFDRIVFVIRKDLEKDFREVIGDRIASHAEVAYVFQEKDDLPEGFVLPADRKKPWGTGQAILACRNVVNEPFCVINADDYYGRKAFESIHSWLVQDHASEDTGHAGHGCGDEYSAGLISENAGHGAEKPALLHMCMAGFILRNTLSENGGVTRGLCSVDEDGYLTAISETKNLIRYGEGAGIKLEDGSVRTVDPETAVSMNMWGFGREFLDVLGSGFTDFLKEHIGTEDENKAEYLLPTIVGDLLAEHKALVSVLPTNDRWFGVTYQEDVDGVKKSIADLVEQGVYPRALWQ